MTQILTYKRTRAKGLATWRPQKKTQLLLDQVNAVLEEYLAHWPLTCRQIFYRLVGAYDYDKTEEAYDRLCDKLVRARRSGIVSFAAIRDDGVTEKEPLGFHSVADFWSYVGEMADSYALYLLDDQPVHVELWVEAAGMVPQAMKVAHPYGVTVYSSGGFDSLTAKYDAARRIMQRAKPTVVLHVGDHDPSGRSIFDSAAEDIGTMVEELFFRAIANGKPVGSRDVEFERAAVTPDQVEHYGLPTAPPKTTDKRGDWTGGTTQAESLSPADLAHEIEEAIRCHIDEDVLEKTKARSCTERDDLIELVRERLIDTEE